MATRSYRPQLQSPAALQSGLGTLDVQWNRPLPLSPRRGQAHPGVLPAWRCPRSPSEGLATLHQITGWNSVCTGHRDKATSPESLAFYDPWVERPRTLKTVLWNQSISRRDLGGPGAADSAGEEAERGGGRPRQHGRPGSQRCYLSATAIAVGATPGLCAPLRVYMTTHVAAYLVCLSDYSLSVPKPKNSAAKCYPGPQLSTFPLITRNDYEYLEIMRSSDS